MIALSYSASADSSRRPVRTPPAKRGSWISAHLRDPLSAPAFGTPPAVSLHMTAPQTASNDNGRPMITTFRLFAVGRSGRRVDAGARSGVTFGVELVWSNGAVTPLRETFPAKWAAVTYGGRAIDAARSAGMVRA